MPPKPKAILALDQGTTSSRALLFDRKGTVLALAQKEFRQYFPKPGWVEHDAQEIWRTQLATARQALRQAGLTGKDLGGIGITNQRETTVVWDRHTGKPVGPAIVWQDRRTAGRCDRMRREGLTSKIRSRTGLVIDPYFSGTKLEWILRQSKAVQRRAEKGDLLFGTIDTWLIWNLTRGRRHVTDPSNACRTLLFHLKNGDWDDWLLKYFNIPRSMLPEVGPSSGILGETDLFSGSVPISGVAGDQQAALFGQACHRPGLAKNTYGTGCFLVLHTGDQPVRSRNQLLSTVAWKIGDRTEYALEGSIFVAGAVVQWLRDGLGLIRKSADIEALAAKVPDTGGVSLVPAFAGLGAPHWDAYARGLIAGLTRGTTAAHIARAALEGIAHQVREVVEAMEADAGRRIKELRVDGGGARNKLLMQFQSDILRKPVVRAHEPEITAFGAAALAGLATGFWPDQKAIAKLWRADDKFRPGMKAADRKQRVGEWDKALSRSRHWIDPEH